MPKKRTIIPFYGKNVQSHEQAATRHAKAGRFTEAKAEQGMARRAYDKNRQRAAGR